MFKIRPGHAKMLENGEKEVKIGDSLSLLNVISAGPQMPVPSTSNFPTTVLQP